MNEPELGLPRAGDPLAEIEEALAEDPADALVEACDEIEGLLHLHEGDEKILISQHPELQAAYEGA